MEPSVSRDRRPPSCPPGSRRSCRSSARAPELRLLGALVALAGCTGEPAEISNELGPCGGRVVEVPLSPGLHVAPGTAIEWDTNPPASGTHYFVWAAWERTYESLDRGYWVHNAEHGGVVFLHNCPAGCPDDVAALEGLVASLPADPRCEPPIRTRTLIAADPQLPAGVTIAAVAWGFTYTASCFDAESLRRFYDEHYGRSYENFCDEGLVP